MKIPQKDTDLHVLSGGMNSDIAPEGMPPNQMRYALNVRSSTFGQRGVITNVMGNVMVETPLQDGENIPLGWADDEEDNKFYFIVYNSNGYHTVFMYDTVKKSVIIVLQSRTDSEGIDILNLNKDYLINHVDIIPSSNGPLITWSDGWEKAVKFNRNKALDKSDTGYGLSIFRDFVVAYKKCAVYAPTVAYITDTSRNSNFLYGKLFKFAVRFIYDDGEVSNWSDYSTVALPANQSYSGLNTITYDNNCIQVSVETGNQLVIKIEIAMKVGSLDFVITSRLDKKNLNIQDNSTYVFNFYNDGADVATSQDKIRRQYSFLPDKPWCQAFVKNAITYSKFFEGFPSINADIRTSVAYEDLYLPDGTESTLNSPAFITTLITNGYTSGSLGVNKRWNVQQHFQIGFDVKKGNKFELFGRNGQSANFYIPYTANAADTAITVANYFKAQLRAIGRGRPAGSSGISAETIDGDGNVSWEYTILGFWNESPVGWSTAVTPVNFQTLQDDGLSIKLIKPGSTRKYAVAYPDDDGRVSNAYTCDAAVVRSGFITEVGELKRAVHTIEIHNPPPPWARYYYLLRTPDSGAWIQLLIQKVIAVDPDPATVAAGNNQKYLDLVVGSLFTYQKLHPNTVIVYDFAKGDRLRPIKYYDGDTKVLYPYLETEVLSYSINTTETVNETITLDGTDTATISGVANASYVGKTVIVNGYERTIINVPAGNKYQFDAVVADGTVGSPKVFSSFDIQDQRGILRIKQPNDIVMHDLSLVELYKPEINESIDGYKEFYPFGVKLEIGNYGTPDAYHVGTVQNQYETGPNDPAIITVTEGDAYERNRELPTNNSVPGTQFLVDHIVDPNFSDFYESDLSDLGRVFPQDEGLGIKWFGSRIRYSNNFIQDTKINGLADFDNADREDYNDAFGDIMLTKFFDQKLEVYRFLKTGWIGIYRRRIESSDGSGTLTVSEKLLNDMIDYAWPGGIGNNPESYVRTNNARFFASTNSGAFLRIAGDGIDSISAIYDYEAETLRMFEIVDRLKLRIFGGWDRSHKEIIWAIPAYNNYIFKGGFVAPDWNTYNDALPEGTTFAITQQPAHGSVTIDGDGNFQLTTGSVLGDDYFLYQATLPDSTVLPVRKECFTVVVSPNRVKAWQVKNASKYCVKLRETAWEVKASSKYCVKEHTLSISGTNTDGVNPYSDSNVDIKNNGMELARITGGGSFGPIVTASGQTLSFEGFSELPSTGSSPTKTMEIKRNGVTIYGPTTNSNSPGDPSLNFSETGVDDASYEVIMSAAATAFEPDEVGILVVDIYSNTTLNAIGFVDTPGAADAYHLPVYTGVNFAPNDGRAPETCYALASDLVTGGGSLSWRFEFNVAALLSQYPGETSLVFKIKGRDVSPGTIAGQYNLKGADAGKMTMGGSTGSYIPSTSGTTNIGITAYSGKATIGGADGTYGIGIGADILTFTYDTLLRTMTLT